MARSSLKPSSRRSPLVLSSPPLFLARYPSSPLHHDSRSSETLAYDVIQPSDQRFDSTALVLHGLLGSGRNWRTFARNLASELSKRSPSDEWRMVLADLRNHGRSAGIRGLEPPHCMVHAARDLANLVKTHDLNWPDVVIGHSMGGKVALEFVASCARGDYGESAVLPNQVFGVGVALRELVWARGRGGGFSHCLGISRNLAGMLFEAGGTFYLSRGLFWTSDSGARTTGTPRSCFEDFWTAEEPGASPTPAWPAECIPGSSEDVTPVPV